MAPFIHHFLKMVDVKDFALDVRIQALGSQAKHMSIKELKQGLQELVAHCDRLIIENNKKSTFVYGLEARPDDRNHSCHVVAYFTTQDIPFKWDGQSSRDDEDHVTWRYSMFTKPTSALTPSELLCLDKLPNHFPYCGF